MKPDEINVLIACEESQAVCIEFRKLGFNAFSNDILPCSGGKPEWHIQDDVFNAVGLKNWHFKIGFPPCTDIAVSGSRWFEEKQKDGRQQASIDFFIKMAKIFDVLENPIGVMSSIYRKPDQIIQPYYFGDPFEKTTCLWLNNNTPPLYHNETPNLFDIRITHVKPEDRMVWVDKKSGKKKSQPYWYAMASQKDGKRGHIRSKTFPGISKAMAMQWGDYLLSRLTDVIN